MRTTSPLPSHQARAGQAFLDAELKAWDSWPAADVSPAGYFRAPLGPDAVTFYQENGFLVLEDALSAGEVAELNADAAAICRGDYGDFRGLETSAPGETDLETISRYFCIHFPHKMSPLMHRALSHRSQVEVLTKVIGPDVKCMQSMLFIKGAGKPGQAWHQDEYFIPTRDRSLMGGWMALDDATVENGCLWVLPGSHKTGIIYPSHSHADRRFDCTGEAEFPFKDEGAVPVEVKAGSIVFFNGYLLHRSLPNKAKSGFRRVLVNHYMSASSLLPWTSPQKPTMMGTHDYRDIVMVAGEDPYSWKGLEDLAAPHVRPSGQGGCGDPKQNTKESAMSAAPRMG